MYVHVPGGKGKGGGGLVGSISQPLLPVFSAFNSSSITLIMMPSLQVSVVGEAVDDVIGDQHVHLLKADVEGFEPGVIASAQKLLAAGRIDNVIMEYSPGVNEKQKT